MRRLLGLNLMSDAIAMHGSRRLSKRAKKANDERMQRQLAEIAKYDEPKPPPDRRAELLAKVALRRQWATMGSKRQANKLLAEAERLEAEVAKLNNNQTTTGGEITKVVSDILERLAPLHPGAKVVQVGHGPDYLTITGAQEYRDQLESDTVPEDGYNARAESTDDD